MAKRGFILEPALAANRYRIEEQLGSGASATVHRAFDTTLGRYVALKIVSPALANEPEFVERFLQEARVASRFDHPNIVTVYDVGTLDDGRPFIALQLVEGPTLEAHIEEHAPFSPAQAVDTLRQVAAALDHVHAAGLVHRDVKPGNVLIDASGRVLLGDFGIALALDSARLTLAGMVMGTPRYMAPEQLMEGNASSASDIFALAVVAFEMLSGKPPFEGRGTSLMYRIIHEEPPPILQVNADLPGSVEPVIARALAKAPEDRWATADEFVAALRDALGMATGTFATALPTSETTAAPMLGAAGASVPSGAGAGPVHLATPPPSGAEPPAGLGTDPAGASGNRWRRKVMLSGVALLAIAVGVGAGAWFTQGDKDVAAGPGNGETVEPAASAQATADAGSAGFRNTTPDPESEATPQRTGSSGETPAATNAAPTNPPVPTPTSTNVPTATNTPAPTATNTPAPTATSTPTPAPPSAPNDVRVEFVGDMVLVQWQHGGTETQGFRVYFGATVVGTNEEETWERQDFPPDARSGLVEASYTTATYWRHRYGVAAFNSAGESPIAWQQ